MPVVLFQRSFDGGLKSVGIDALRERIIMEGFLEKKGEAHSGTLSKELEPFCARWRFGIRDLPYLEAEFSFFSTYSSIFCSLIL